MSAIQVGRFRLRFDWQILPLILSAVVGLALAYNRTVAALQFVLFCAAVVVYLFLLNQSDPRPPQRSILRLILASLPLVIGVFFLLTNDWVRWAEKLSFLTAVTQLVSRLSDWPGLVGHQSQRHRRRHGRAVAVASCGVAL